LLRIVVLIPVQKSCILKGSDLTIFTLVFCTAKYTTGTETTLKQDLEGLA